MMPYSNLSDLGITTRWRHFISHASVIEEYNSRVRNAGFRSRKLMLSRKAPNQALVSPETTIQFVGSILVLCGGACIWIFWAHWCSIHRNVITGRKPAYPSARAKARG